MFIILPFMQTSSVEVVENCPHMFETTWQGMGERTMSRGMTDAHLS